MTETELKTLMSRVQQLCRSRDVKLTAQRATVLELLWRADKPLTAYEILGELQGRVKSPTPPTVYRALDFLIQHGLAHKLESLHAYVSCMHPEHQHAGHFLICTDCGDVNELEDDVIAASLRSAELSSGFTASREVVEILGTCGHCNNSNL